MRPNTLLPNFFLLLLSLTLAAQPAADSMVKVNALKFAPLNLLDFINTSVEVSYERAISQRFSWQISGAYFLPKRVVDWDEDFNNQSKGGRLRVEGRKYFSQNHRALNGYYAAVDLSYLHNNYNAIHHFGEDWYYEPDSIPNIAYFDTVNVRKQTYTLNVKFGQQTALKRLVLDVYVGIGLKYRDVMHRERINPADELSQPRHPNVIHISDREAHGWTISLPINLKLGYVF